MKSFRLQLDSKSELIQSVVALLVGAAVFLALHYFNIAETVSRVIILLVGAAFAGYLCRGHLCRALRQRYPNARWIPLLAIGFSIGTFGGIARFVLPRTDDASFTLAFIVPMGVCIAVFVIINRRDPDVTK